jgi:hypothetical protein
MKKVHTVITGIFGVDGQEIQTIGVPVVLAKNQG